MRTIDVNECPICGKIIPPFEYIAMPELFEKIETKRRSVVLVHKYCIKKVREKQNEHKQSKEE